MPPPQHRIRDPALRRLLARHGYLTNGVLNEKSRRWDWLQISGEGIKSLDGIQYFTHVKALEIVHTRLRRFDFLPPNFENLNCSNNALLTVLPPLPATLQTLNCSDTGLRTLPPLPVYLQMLVCTGNHLTELPPLPAYLKILQCADNRLTALPPLPATLTQLDLRNNRLAALPPLPLGLETLTVSHNRLTRLPPTPPGLTVFNYFGNPIPDSALPAAYRPLPCRSEAQNCQPNPLINGHILNAQIPDTAFEIVEMQVVTRWRGGLSEATGQQTVVFRPWGDYLLASNEQDECRKCYFQMAHGVRHTDTTFVRPVNYAVRTRDLQDIIRRIRRNDLVFDVNLNDSLQTPDLRYRILSLADVGSCNDCGEASISYLIRTTGAPMRLHYAFDDMGSQPISPAPNPQPQVHLPNWLYMYQLATLNVPKNELVKTYFRANRLREIVRWAR